MKKIVLMAAVAAVGASPAFSQSSPITFNARSLVVLSDADLSASSYVDGKLLRDATSKDRLTTVKFPLVRGEAAQSVLVPNSAINTSKSIAVPPTGGLAFVIESTTSPAESVKELKDVITESPVGQRVYVVDIVNPLAPKVKFPFSIGNNPLAIDIFKNELIISTAEVGKKLGFLETDNDGKPTRLLYLPIDTDSTQNLADVSWHPSGDYVAATLAPSGELVVYKILRENGKLKNIETVGKPVKLGDKLSYGKFSADGSKYLVVDTKDAIGKATAEGELLVVTLDLTGGDHKVAGKTAIGLNPGAFAINPEGSLIVSAHAGAGIQPWADANAGVGGQLTLLKIAADGAVTKVADYPVGGILPGSVAFDKDGTNVAVTVFEYVDYGTRTGGVEFFSVTAGDTPSLTAQPGKISVENGAHTLRVIP